MVLTDWNGVTQSIALNQFDPSFGTLNSVTLTLYSDLDSTGSVQNNSPGAIIINQYDAFLRTRILAPGTSVPATLSTPYLLDAEPTLVSLSPQTILSGGAWGTTCRGVGAVCEYVHQRFGILRGDGTCHLPALHHNQDDYGSFRREPRFVQTTRGRAEAIITYNYTAAVPEPSTFALLVPAPLDCWPTSGGGSGLYAERPDAIEKRTWTAALPYGGRFGLFVARSERPRCDGNPLPIFVRSGAVILPQAFVRMAMSLRHQLR